MANLKGKSGIAGLVLLHGEKVAIALVGLVALWLIYKTTTLPRLEDKYQATKLRDAISQTSSAITGAQWPDKGSELATEVREAQPIDLKADIGVNVKLYDPQVGGFDSTIIAPTVLRTDPVLVNAVEVRATGGSGLFAFIDEKIRKEQERIRQLEEQERAKKEEERLAREAKNNAAGGAGPEGGRRNRGPEGGPGEGAVEVFDPQHPTRRRLEGQTQAFGVPLQGGERIETVYWAVVTAKVPIREQLKLYQDAFEKARGGFDPTRDFPQYKGYKVQRAEVLPGKPLDWKAVPVYDGQRQKIQSNSPINRAVVSTDVVAALYEEAAKSWAGMSPDVIDARFADYVLTLPLPPLVGRNWAAEAKHPDFPMLADTPPLEEETQVIAPDAPKQPAETDENATFSTTNPNQAVPGGNPYAMLARPTFGGGRGGIGPEGGGPGFGARMGPRGPGGVGPEGGMMRGGGGGSFAGAPGARVSLPKGVDFLMLRFFDFTVEPGKKYKYRVMLVLADPNAMSLDNVLAPEVLDRRSQELQAAKAQGRTTRPDFRLVKDWSEPSPTIGIPLAGGVKLADIKLPAVEKINDEPTITLLVDSFDVDEKNNAIQAAKERVFRRGSVANMVEDAEYSSEDWIDTKKGFKFLTGMTLIDVEGGKKLTKDFNTPGRVLLMGPAGDFYIRNELDDKPAVVYYKYIFDDSAKHKNAAGPEGGLGQPGPGGNRGPRAGRGRNP